MLVGIFICHSIRKAETIWCNDQNGVWFPPGRWAVGRVLREWTWPDIVVSFDRRPFIKQQSLVRDLDLSALIEPLMFFGTVNFIIVWNPIVFLFSFFFLLGFWMLQRMFYISLNVIIDRVISALSAKSDYCDKRLGKYWDYHAKSVIFSV